jgi:hypothetical protein
MKRLLVISLALALVFGLSSAVLAFEKADEGVQITGRTTQSLGGVHPKDFCVIHGDYHDVGYVSVWYTGYPGYGSGFTLKKLIDPYAMYSPEPSPNDCPEPIFPFSVESSYMSFHAAFHPSSLPPLGVPDSLVYIFTFDIEELGDWYESIDCVGPEPWYDCYYPGAVLWESELLTYTIDAGTAGQGDYDVMIATWEFPNVMVTGPFYLSFHLQSVWGIYGTAWEEMEYFGQVTDKYEYYPDPPLIDAVFCWNFDRWLEGVPPYDWYEWGCLWPGAGNLIMGCDGRPEWNVAVDLGSFETVPGEGMVTVNWQSLVEHNNSHWIIERDDQEIWKEQGQGSKETPTEYTYVDRDVVNGVEYSYTLKAVNYEGNIDEFGPALATSFASVPTNFVLWQNYPNPFNASTVIRYQLSSEEYVTLKVYNIYGQEIASLVEADQKAGTYTVSWTGKGVSSGIYVYTLTAGNYSESKKMVFVK